MDLVLLNMLLMFINDLQLGVNSELVKFTDDPKLLKLVNTKADYEVPQKDVLEADEWTSK